MVSLSGVMPSSRQSILPLTVAGNDDEREYLPQT